MPQVIEYLWSSSCQLDDSWLPLVKVAVGKVKDRTKGI